MGISFALLIASKNPGEVKKKQNKKRGFPEYALWWPAITLLTDTRRRTFCKTVVGKVIFYIYQSLSEALLNLVAYNWNDYFHDCCIK